MKRLLLSAVLLMSYIGISAQDMMIKDSTKVVVEQPTDDKFRVVTNRFWDNWFVFGNVGAHLFSGDYSSAGDFSDRISPDLFVGVGKWFTPTIGAKIQFGGFESKGFSKEQNVWNVGSPLKTDDGTTYWKTKIKWWDLSANVMFNLSRMFKGYEGLNSDKLKNQFILSAGIGTLHHFDTGGPQLNEWSGHLELQYSRFFTKEKKWSLDAKLHGIFYQTNFDDIVIKENYKKEGSHWWDTNVGLSVGVTYYFNKRGWERCTAAENIIYDIVPVPAPIVEKCPEYKTMTFYIFYPNNYSGRNDAPIVKDAEVNAIDYLAGGIFTQKKFEDNEAVASRIADNRPLNNLATTDVQTEKAIAANAIDGTVRGYELASSPISLSMNPEDMKAFEEKAGYYYAPVYDGQKAWYYRIDNETKGQRLLNAENYKENESYGLNGRNGLQLIKQNMKIEEGTQLFSFADVYAALEGNTGYISQYADAEAVKELQKIFSEGNILHIQAEGLATSQDNYIGEDAENVGINRNKTLSFNRAMSAIEWLKGNPNVKVSDDKYSINALAEPIGKVDDKSTQGLNAKLNRCVKVQIQYIIK